MNSRGFRHLLTYSVCFSLLLMQFTVDEFQINPQNLGTTAPSNTKSYFNTAASVEQQNNLQ